MPGRLFLFLPHFKLNRTGVIRASGSLKADFSYVSITLFSLPLFHNSNGQGDFELRSTLLDVSSGWFRRRSVHDTLTDLVLFYLSVLFLCFPHPMGRNLGGLEPAFRLFDASGVCRPPRDLMKKIIKIINLRQ